MLPPTTLRRWAGLVLLAIAAGLLAAAVAGIYRAGYAAGQAACTAAQATQERQQRQAETDTVRELNRAIAHGQAALRQAQAQRTAFAASIAQETYRADRPPLAVRASAPRVARIQPQRPALPQGEPVGGSLALAGHLAAQQPELPQQPHGQLEPEALHAPPGAPDAGPGGDELQLTAHAVRLWDSALAGEHLPRAGCTAADPTAPACAAEAGVTLADALANHATNAALCAADRANLLELQAAIHRIRGTVPAADLSTTAETVP